MICSDGTYISDMEGLYIPIDNIPEAIYNGEKYYDSITVGDLVYDKDGIPIGASANMIETFASEPNMYQLSNETQPYTGEGGYFFITKGKCNLYIQQYSSSNSSLNNKIRIKMVRITQ